MGKSEARRFELHLELKRILGDDVADNLMDYLPPTSWSDVARKRDVDVIERRIEVIERRINVAITGGLAFALALLALQVQIVLSIANL
ncbi:MAG: hypothetical protein RL119_1262 [Actinomycetota bacterium]|jgi:hypothetical protein